MNLHEFILSHLHTCQTRLLDTLKFPLWEAILRSPGCAESKIFSWKQACEGTTFNSPFDSDIQIFEMPPFQWSVSAHTKTKSQNDSFSTPLCWINKDKKQIDWRVCFVVWKLFAYLPFWASLSTPQWYPTALSLWVETVDDGSKVWWLQHLSNLLRDRKNPKGSRLSTKNTIITHTHTHIYWTL